MSSIFKTQPIPNGYSWTITSKFGHILRTAEDKFGERDKSYTLLGIEITNQDVPRIWYPGNCKNVIIQITKSCLEDMDRAVFQVAHETIHCLSPTGGQNANVLEEGLANLFSIQYCQDNGHGNGWKSDNKKYTEATNLVMELLKFDPDIIKKLRASEPTISRITKELIRNINPSIPKQLIDDLIRKF